MVGILEAAGYTIVGGTMAQVALGLFGAVRRQAAEASRARKEAHLFSERARLLLDTERAERDRSELSWNGVRKFYIERKVEEAKDVCSFYLKPHDGKSLAPFLPGQYLTFQLRIPGQPKSVVRCYSLSDSPTEHDYYRVTIKRLDPPPKAPDAPPGLSSNFFHRQLNEGDILDVKAPGGHFYLDQTSDKPVVLIGGGVGLTPVLSMLNTIVGSGSRRETWFFYGVTNRNDHAMYEHLNAIRKAHNNVRIVVCYSRPSEDCVEGRDYDHAGFVGIDLFKKLLPSNNYEFYICGPPPMMDAITNGLSEWGVPDDTVHFEAFGPASVKRNKPSEQVQDAVAAAAGAEGIEIVFARSGKTLHWKPAGGSILEFAEENGLNLDFGCRAGNCGTCVTAIKEGDVSYLSEPGAAPEAGSCLTCIAVPKSRLVLDS
jgi:ferredoxin-NADP reductase